VELACACACARVCVRALTSGRKMAGRHLHNMSITFVEDSIGGRDSNEVDEISSLDSTAINQEAETEVIVLSECIGNNSDSIVITEVKCWYVN